MPLRALLRGSCGGRDKRSIQPSSQQLRRIVLSSIKTAFCSQVNEEAEGFSRQP